VSRARAKEAMGKDASAEWQEYEGIARVGPLRSRLDGDWPNFRLLQLEVISDFERNRELLLPIVPRLARKIAALRKRLDIDDASLELMADAREALSVAATTAI
jgi:hypothetical protein